MAASMRAAWGSASGGRAAPIRARCGHLHAYPGHEPRAKRLGCGDGSILPGLSVRPPRGAPSQRMGVRHCLPWPCRRPPDHRPGTGLRGEWSRFRIRPLQRSRCPSSLVAGAPVGRLGGYRVWRAWRLGLARAWPRLQRQPLLWDALRPCDGPRLPGRASGGPGDAPGQRPLSPAGAGPCGHCARDERGCT